MGNDDPGFRWRGFYGLSSQRQAGARDSLTCDSSGSRLEAALGRLFLLMPCESDGHIRCDHEIVSTIRCAEKPQALHPINPGFSEIQRIQKVSAAQALLEFRFGFRSRIGFAMMENLRRVAFAQQHSTLECVDRSSGTFQ